MFEAPKAELIKLAFAVSTSGESGYDPDDPDTWTWEYPCD